MGWLSGFNSRSDIERSVLDQRGTLKDGTKAIWKTLAKAWVGNHLWVVMQTVREDDAQPITEPFIVLYLCERRSMVGGFADWAYKDLDEGMHPYYYTCPLKFLKMAPVVNQEWRDQVMAAHTLKQRLTEALKSGKPVRLRYNGDEFDSYIRRYGKSRRMFVFDYKGCAYRADITRNVVTFAD